MDAVSGAPFDEGRASLGTVLRELSAGTGLPLHELTVLAKQNDPYRADTPAGHRDGAWFREQLQACGLLGRRTIHLRGCHYAIMSLGGVVRPDGKPYLNNEESWTFLQERASKAARWLGYVPFEAIADARNAAPVIRKAETWLPPSPFTGVTGMSAEELDAISIDFEPFVTAKFDPRPQPYRIAIFGEKSSLQDTLEPMAEWYAADLYLPSGEISDTLVHAMAKAGAEDVHGRELIVLVLADCDPAGYQMAVSIGHKLRALHDSLLPGLRFSLVAPCLTVGQVQALGLPSTPLKETERRADGWRERYVVEQTEIDALATLQPRVFQQIVEDALGPYFDRTLAGRTSEAALRWHRKAAEILEADLENSDFEILREKAQASLGALRDALRESSAKLDDAVVSLDVRFPVAAVPEPELDEPPPPLVSSDMHLGEAIAVLRGRKDYSGGGK